MYRAEHGATLHLVWDSERPSTIAPILTASEVSQAILQVYRREITGDHVGEHAFVEMLTPYARSTGRYDMVLLLREHGLVQKHDGEIVTTAWGRQFANSYAEPIAPS